MAYRLSMGKILAFLRLMRFGNCLMAAVAVLVGVRLAGFPVITVPSFLAALGTLLVCAAGNIHNDVVDLAADRISHAHRELVKGTISPRTALYGAFALNAAAMVLAASVNRNLLILAFTAAVLLVLYNLRIKRIPLLGNLIVASLGGLVLWTGGLVNSELTPAAVNRLLAGAGLAFCLHLIREIIKDICDMAGDEEAGVRTLPHYLGISVTLGFTLVLGLLLVGGTVAPIILGWFKWPFAIITLVLIDLPILGMLNMLWLRPNPDRLRLMAAALKVAMGLGLLALVLGV